MFYKDSTDFYGSYNVSVGYDSDVTPYDVITDMDAVAKHVNMGFTPVNGTNTVYSDFSDISQVTADVLAEADDIDVFLKSYRNRYNKSNINSNKIVKPTLVWSNPVSPKKTATNRTLYLVK